MQCRLSKISILAGVITFGALAHSPALAGVVFQVETTYHSGSPGVESSEMSVEKPNIKMEIASGRGRSGDTQQDVAIYNGDRRQMVVVDHRDKSYMVVDSASAAQLRGQLRGQMGGQMQQAMKELEKRLDQLDPKQREMVEKMLKGKMDAPGATMPSPRRVRSEFRRSSERATKQGYPTVRYDVFRGGEKVQELWVTSWDNIPGGSDVTGSFKEMADFWEEMMDSFDDIGGGFSGGDRHSIDVFSRINGFPVVTRDFEGGELESETVLESITERDLDPDAFEPPKGYRLRTMGPQ